MGGAAKKYKVGDIVWINSKEWYNKNKDDDGLVRWGMLLFDKDMSQYCGKEAEIIAYSPMQYPFSSGYSYVLDIDSGKFDWFDFMLEDCIQPESHKNDRKDGKLMWELLPLITIKEVVKVFTFGAKKYGPNRWQNLENGYDRYKAALFRHIVAYEEGEVKDPESGIHHLAHAAWNALAMLYLAMKK